jgi:hypothetical protein
MEGRAIVRIEEGSESGRVEEADGLFEKPAGYAHGTQEG